MESFLYIAILLMGLAWLMRILLYKWCIDERAARRWSIVVNCVCGFLALALLMMYGDTIMLQ